MNSNANQAFLDTTTGLESIRDSEGLRSRQSNASRTGPDPENKQEREAEIIALESQRKRIEAQLTALSIGSGTRSSAFVTINYARAGAKESIPIVLPVRELDGRVIGAGKPGPVTLKLHRFFIRQKALAD